MAHLDYTRPHMGTAYDITLCITAAECKALLPTMKAALKKQQQQYEKYKDIQESGEATTRQQTAFMLAEESVSHLKDVIEKAQQLIESHQRNNKQQ